MTNKETNIITTSYNQGQKLNIAGGEYRIIISGEQNNGSFAVIEMTVPPGAGPVPHSHPDFEETFYVLEGEVLFKSETGEFTAKKDSFVAIPKGGIVHNFKNLSDKPAKLLCTVIPAGLEAFFNEVADYMDAKKDNLVSEIKEDMARISDKYGQKLYSLDYWD
ncbi:MULTISPECIES: cupin domain-containing protein [unclassified Flavobacterium]|uniref:cupin domain-containing protein n=1 Tax=unclassified Flavobacterium TaxID=196869 RepID=UPI003F8DADE1